MLVRLFQVCSVGVVVLVAPVCAESAGTGKSVKSSSAKVLNELRYENSSLKEQQQVLIDYAKQLRQKNKELQNTCLRTETDRRHAVSENKKSCPQSGDVIPLSQYQDLKREFENIQNSSSGSKVDMQGLAKKLSESEERNSELESKLTKMEKEFEEYKVSKESELHELTLRNTNLHADLESKTAKIRDYSRQVENSQEIASRLPAMEKEFLSLKNELLLRKTAEEILLPGANAAKSKKSDNSDNVAVARTQKPAVTTETKVFSDVMVLEVTGNKVSLRVGPGTQHSPVMDVQKGTKLTVEAKENDWYRVLTSTGSRAFIHSNYARIVSGSGAGNSRSASQRARLDIEPVKPPLPSKPVRRAGGNAVTSDSDEEAVEVSLGGNSSEKLAIEKLMKAMSEMAEQEKK